MARNDCDGPLRRAVVADKFPLVVETVAAQLAAAGISVAARVADGDAALAAIRECRAEIAVLGSDLDGSNGLAVLQAVRDDGLPTRIILLGTADPALLLDAVELGVEGLILKTSPVAALQSCLAAAAAAQQWLDPAAMEIVLEHIAMQRRGSVPQATLTRRERDVARLVATGQRNRGIAAALGISEGTVKMHLHNVYAKLGLESRTQLAMDVRARA